MSITKRYLESLPQAEQDAILGGIDNAYISPDEAGIDPDYEAWRSEREALEWTNDAENEPTHEELAEWGRMLMEEDDEPVDAEDEELYDPLVKCRICRKSALISTMNTNGECASCQVDSWIERAEAQLVKPQPPSVKAGCFDV